MEFTSLSRADKVSTRVKTIHKQLKPLKTKNIMIIKKDKKHYFEIMVRVLTFKYILFKKRKLNTLLLHSLNICIFKNKNHKKHVISLQIKK